MRKGLAVVAAAAILTRILIQGGMQDGLAARLQDALADGNLLHASIQLELGTPAATAAPSDGPAASPEAPLDTPEETALPLPLVVGEEEDSETPPDGEESNDAEKTEEDGGAEIRAATIDGSKFLTNDTEQEIDVAACMAEGLSLRLPADSPQILIIHTHSTEAYSPADGESYEATGEYRTTDREHSVVKVGDVLAEALTAQGLVVLHDRGIYDYPSYAGSYGRSGAAVESYLSEYPDLAVVIDLHRDALGDGDVVYKTMAEVQGETSSQLMLLVCTGESGLAHPLWRENLKLALALQSAVNEDFPTLARPVAVKPERYNQQLTTGSLLLEVGSSGNTLSEALCAVRLFAEAAGPLLLSLVEGG
jgi:stage II sporulation protein P